MSQRKSKEGARIKCTNCNATGLKSDVERCPVCLGFANVTYGIAGNKPLPEALAHWGITDES